MSCFTHYLQYVSPKSPSALLPPANIHTEVEQDSDGGRRGRCCHLTQTESSELATLCLLSGDIRSRLPLPCCHNHHCHPDGARGGAKPLEESFLPSDAKAEETAGPCFRVSGYFKKAAQFMAASHIIFLLYGGLIFFVSNVFFPPVCPNRLDSCWLIDRK